MIYERRGFGGFGQRRERGGRVWWEDVPREGAAPGEGAVEPDTTGYAPAAQLIASSVLSAMQSGYGVTADQAVRMANAQINPAQRFYEVEFHHAATLLSQSYPAVQIGAWLHHLGNNMGYRKVIMPICAYGEVVDPVTRACVPERVLIPQEEVPEERREEKREEEKAFQLPVWAWGVGAALAVLVLVSMGGRR